MPSNNTKRNPLNLRVEKQFDMLKANNDIREMLRKRFYDLDMSLTDIIKDADEYGVKISKGSLSRYLLHKVPLEGSLPHQTVLFLAIRWGLRITVMSELNTYNEELCRQKAKKFFKKIEEIQGKYFTEKYYVDDFKLFPYRFHIFG